MFKRIIMFSVMMFVGAQLSACGPARTDVFEEVGTSETAFLIPMESGTKQQKQLFSVDYLNKNKVATKRIYLPLKSVTTGRWWWSYKWVETMRVIKVDRKPVTFVWADASSIKVESRDSIGFGVGINISAFIEETNTATFLYYYPSGNLTNVLGNEILSRATEVLSKEFAKYDLEGGTTVRDTVNNEGLTIEKGSRIEGARERKGQIVTIAKKSLVNYFAEKGVTITTFGLVGGLAYENVAIQDAIDNNFKSELEIVNKINERLAQKEVNAKELAVVINDKDKAKEFEKTADSRVKQIQLEVELIKAQTGLVWAENWDGKLPSSILPDNSNMMFNMQRNKAENDTTYIK